jgi:hypothetical protein
MDNRLHDEPSEVSVENAEVHVDGPDGVAVALTADAAAETSDRLLAAAATAKGQEAEIRRVAEERRLNGLT